MSFRQHFRSGGIVVVICAALASIFHSSEFIQRLEASSLDAVESMLPATDLSELLVVEIDDDAYTNRFGATSPLNTTRVLEVLKEVAALRPAVIAVDLDTSSWKDAGPSSIAGIPVVWARGGKLLEGDGHEPKLELAPVAGDATGAGLCWGVPLSETRFGAVRSYFSWVRDAAGEEIPSFPRAIAQAFRDPSKAVASCGETQNHEPMRGSAHRLIALHATRAARLRADDVSKLAAAPSPPSTLQGRIALIGGTYGAARDAYVRRGEDWHGVDLVALEVAMELDGGRGHTALWAYFLLDIVFGLALVAGLYFLPHLARIAALLLGVPLLYFFLSIIVLRTGIGFLSFVPLLLGLVLHESAEQLHEWRGLQKEHEALKNALAATKAASDGH